MLLKLRRSALYRKIYQAASGVLYVIQLSFCFLVLTFAWLGFMVLYFN